jgi:predicted RNA binding protein YcfA (HicA-like mRNA interferase family)
MSNLPALKSREFIRGLERLGFSFIRQRGSHAMYHHEDCRRAPIPVHPSKTLSPYFISDVLKQLKIAEDDFLVALRDK